MIATSRCRLHRAMRVGGVFTALLTCGGLSQVWADGLSGLDGAAAGGDAPSSPAVAAVPFTAAAASREEGSALLPKLLPSAFGAPARRTWGSHGATSVGGWDGFGQRHMLAAVPAAPSGGGRSEGPPKSVGRALLYSAILPGAGELYAGSWRRAAVFFGLEVVGWGVYLNWNDKGKDIEDEFRARADTTWSPLSYLAWRNSTISRNSSITHALPCSSFVANITSSTTVPEALAGCAGAERQQYYELIGKYNQFVAGWEDLSDQNGFVRPTEVDSAENFLSEIRLTYEDRRNDSNRFLKRASTVGGLILVNHVISAVDAARVAKKRRDGEGEARIAARTRLVFFLREDSRGRSMPMLVAYRPLR